AEEILVLDRHELAAGKLAAAFSRMKSRDLFDLRGLLEATTLDLGRLRRRCSGRRRTSGSTAGCRTRPHDVAGGMRNAYSQTGSMSRAGQRTMVPSRPSSLTITSGDG